MRIIVPGGAGDMGSVTVADLAEAEGVEQVTIADRNVAAAEALCTRLSGSRARLDVCEIDANNHSALVEALRGYDLAASALGPFYKFEPKLVRAAIEAGVNYISICDDWIACEQVLNEYDGPAREAGVTVITGMGASPGLTNLLACYLARELDRTERIEIACYQPWSAGGGEAVFRHLLFIISGEIASFQDGEAGHVPACSVEHYVEMPLYGRRRLWNLGHAEPVSLPRFFPDLKSCSFYMGLGTGMGLLVALAKRGLFKGEKRADLALRLLAPFERFMAGAKPGLSSIRVDVWGEVHGEPAHRMACGTGVMRQYTGLPLAAGALFLGRGELSTTGPGVFTPESSLHVDALLPCLKEKGIVGYTDLAMTQPLA